MEAIQELTDDQLEAELTHRKVQKQKEKERAKHRYEKQRDAVVKELISQAAQISESLTDFKQLCHEQVESQQELLAAYGGIRKTSKGGFSITTGSGEFRVTRRRDTTPNWDERADKATALITDFLRDIIKKRDIDLFEILMGFLERNFKGDMEYSKVFNLIKYQDKFDDERWVTGLDLLKESYSTHLKGYAYEFKTIDSSGKWQSLTMNFSAV